MLKHFKLLILKKFGKMYNDNVDVIGKFLNKLLYRLKKNQMVILLYLH